MVMNLIHSPKVQHFLEKEKLLTIMRLHMVMQRQNKEQVAKHGGEEILQPKNIKIYMMVWGIM